MIEDKKRCQLIEKLGVHFEQKEKIAPVAARIKSYIILNGKKGTTFEELIEKLCASKSTISTHLTHLQGSNKITYFTKIGDRKKYFILNPDSIIQSIDEMISTWTHQRDLHSEVKQFKEDMNHDLEEIEKFDLDFHSDYVEFLNQTITSVLILKEKLINKNN
ncbi:DNA-binding transcriptional regulator GbsR (MarR family) [Wenyingzhuangia heitensis]|uniref:DNA-binding transcriptional regulator GbsR (MarR family) n=1 Tax=Wenyingzhuangia heitensis TaxID=1487859 RepID=A0ABX0UC82_9FLAO|nr:transcriptional regulator [Wenyingzhuangia heitensis]NIJ46437.1 DNA-binding transcriptional regulator GbsR (MarR family) [Wenyingzhuangia heitensis]